MECCASAALRRPRAMQLAARRALSGSALPVAVRGRMTAFPRPLRLTQQASQRRASTQAQRRAAPAPQADSRSVIRRLAHEMTSRQRSAVEITDAYLAAIAAAQPSLRAFLATTPEAARAAAAAVDARRAAGEVLGPLAGIPLAIKDNICTRGVATTAGSRILASYVPPYDAAAAARLSAAGAVLVGKTNMDEFGMGSSTENSAYGTTANPWGGGSRVPGGSSGGSAAAVAARLCAGALGTDTGGSIRQPAAFCGCVGLKPSYGRVSRQGLIAYASSLDVIGPMGNSVEDCALLLNAIAGGDVGDATCASVGVEDYAAGLLPASSLASAPLKGVRVGLVRETATAGLQPGVADALRAFAAHATSLGAEIVDVSLPSFALGLPAYYVIAPAEASSNLARYDGLRFGPQEARATVGETMSATRGALFGDEVKRRILMGTYALSAGYQDAYYTRAQRVRTLIRAEMCAALAGCDVLLTPAAPTTAYALGSKTADPLAMYAGDMTTVNVNLAGLPALALPWGLAEALPVGVQLIGRDFGERELLRIAHACEVTAPPLGAPPGFEGPAV